MIRYACGMAVAIFLLVEAPSGWSQQYYLYAPKPVGAEEKIQKKDGILVQEIPVKKGDTLYGISRKFNGHGSYFPQILLFNDIKNPNRIYPGNVFKIPVPRNTEAPSVQKQVSGPPSAASVTDISTHNLKKVAAGRKKKRGAREKGAGPAKKQVTIKKQHPAAAGAGDSASGQKLFERAVKAYRQDDCRTALELFDRFLAENQASPLAADASLYKAECYLKLSTQN